MKSLFNHFETLENPKDIINKYCYYDNIWYFMWIHRLY